MATPSTASAAVTAAPAAPAATFPLRTRFVDDKRATEKLLPIKGGNNFLGLAIVANLSKAEAPRLTRKAIAKQR